MTVRRHALGTACVITLLAVSACSDEDGPAAEPDNGAVIVARSSTEPTGPPDVTKPDVTELPPVTSPPTGSIEPSATAVAASTVPGTLAPTTTAPGVVEDPVVGDPVVASELVVEVEQPVDLAVRPGDAALYLVGQGGVVTRFDPTSGVATVVHDIAGRVSTGGEQGLLGLAFSPDAARAYLNFTDTNGDTNVVEYTVDADGVFDPTSERSLLVVDQPYSNHNAGDLTFGPDGMLYITMGDGGSGGDPERRASDPTSLLGSLLRIDPTPSGELAYTIPSDNPFASGSLEGVEGAPEVWAWGLRNPWKIAFDTPTSRLWVADVGQNAHEEINVVEPAGDTPAGWGANFGWSAFEGTERFNDDVPDPGDTVMPVLTYPHSQGGCSISGGIPYRGSAIAELAPAYVYSDYCLGTIWALDLGGQRNLVLLDGFSAVSSVSEGPDGELYVLEQSGGVHRLVPG